MDDIEFQVRTFVAEIRGLKSMEECPLDARVRHDLGAVGDDAIELFEAFAEKFKVDLTELDKEWDTYFRSEFAENYDLRRSGPSAIAGMLFVALGLAISLDGWKLFFFCLPCALLTLAVSNYFYPYGKTDKRPLSISLMVDAARLGHWQKSKDATSGAVE